MRCQLDWNGEAMDRLLDEAHARLVERIVRWLDRAGWQTAVEVSFNVFGERGYVDVLARHPAMGAWSSSKHKTESRIFRRCSRRWIEARLGIRIAASRAGGPSPCRGCW